MKRDAMAPRIIITSILLIMFCHVSAQTVSDTIASDTATAPGQKESIHSLYGGAGMGSNMIYLGYTLSQDRPFGYGYISYGLKDKLYFSATGYTLSDLSPFIAYYSLDMSFAHTFNSWFDISLSLSRYNVQESLKDTLFNSFSYADATVGFDWKILYTKFSVGGVLAEENGLYLQFRNSRYFETPSFAKDKAYFYFDPYVNLLLGTMYRVDTSETTTGGGWKPGNSPWGNGGTTTTSTVISDKFGFMELDFGLPIAFTYDFFTIEAEPGYILPLYDDNGAQEMKGFIFMISAFFRFF